MKRHKFYAAIISVILLITVSLQADGQQLNAYLSFENGILQNADHFNTLPARETANGGEEYYNIDFYFPGANIANTSVNDIGYQFLHIKGFAQMGQIGAPALPAHNEVIAMPPGAEGNIVIINSSYLEYDGYMIHPALEPAWDTDGAPDPEFWIDDEIYNKDEFFPKSIVEITNIALLRGIPLAYTQIRPVQFNPVTGKIRVYTQIDFKLEYKGNKQSFTSIANENSLHFTNKLKRLVINSDNIPEGITRNTESKAGEKEYIIITHDQYLTAANDLANWKRQMGYSVEVVSSSSWTESQVQSAIQTRYDAWTPKPDYFVIIGDHDGSYAVPGKVIYTPYYPDPDYEGPFATDLYHACMDGSSDWHPDIASGRISASSLTEAQVIIDKIINYEKTPPTTGSFYTDVLNCAQYQDDDNNGYADRRFCHTSEDIRDYLQDEHSYASTRVYHTDATTTLSTRKYNNTTYSNGQLIPAELRSTSFNWAGGATEITSEIDAGKFLVFHRDHGYSGGSGWHRPYYTTTSMNSLNNGNLLPVVFSINCHTGEYQLPNCFAEKFMRMENKGAVGVVGASYFSLSGWNDAISIGMIDAIWADPGLYPVFGTGGTGTNYTIGAGNEIRTMGDVVLQGLYCMEQNFNGSSTYDQYEYELFMYFGDPAMKIWTENPNSNTITAIHSPNIDCSLTSFSITGSEPNAIATLVFNNEIIGAVELNGSGAGTITYAISSPGSTVTLTISKTNCKPYITDLIIIGACNPPSMRTDPSTSVTNTTAIFNGEILSPNGTVTESGFVFSSTSNPVIGGPGVVQVQTSPLVTNGSFSVPVTGLSLATTYYVKAYAISEGGTGYGGEESFTTNDGIPIVTTDPATTIGSNSATFNGEIIDENGFAITESGFVYSTSSDPVIGGPGVTAVQTFPLVTNGTYSIPTSGLSPASTYFVKAYAINSVGTGYGTQESFATDCGIISTLPFMQEFTTYALPACWENIDHDGSGQVWTFTDPNSRAFNSSTAGNGYALLDSDAYGDGSSQDADLVTPEFDFSGFVSVNLEFEHLFRSYSGSSIELLYSINGGSNWSSIQGWTADIGNYTTGAPVTFSQDLTSEVAGQSSVKFKWNYAGSWGYYWLVDDVSITGVEGGSTVLQSINLSGGWNIFSFCNTPPDPNMLTIVQPLIDGSTLVKVSSEGAGFIQYITGSWMNTIGDMSNTEGYYINVTGTTNLSTNGPEVTFPFDIPLTSGWNIMGYPCDVSQTAITVLQPLIDAGYLVKVIDEAGGFIQYITGIGWINSINTFEPGEGYYINVNSNFTLTLSDPGKGTDPFIASEAPQTAYFTSFVSNPFSPMNVLIGDIYSDDFTVEAGDEIAVYDGLVEVGSMVVQQTDDYFQMLTLRADDPTTEMQDGFVAGGELTFRYWDKSENVLYTDIEVTQLFGDKKFTRLGTFGADLKIGSLGLNENGLPNDNYLSQNYPNPYTEHTYIEYGIAEDAQVLLSIYDVYGRKVKEVENMQGKAGNYKLTLNRSSLESGIYYYRLDVIGQNAKFSETRKMILY